MSANVSSAEAASSSEGAQEDSYSGEASYLYSSKIMDVASVSDVCEVLVDSNVFSFALNNSGRIYFKEGGRLRSQVLTIKTTAFELGMTISGHENVMAANPGSVNDFSFSDALDLHLSERKLFNAAVGFPVDNARIFMRPIAIKMKGDDGYEFFIPNFRVYSGGIITVSLTSIGGFENATVRRVIDEEVNKSVRNISSILCEKELFLASAESQVSQMPLRERLAERKRLKGMFQSSLNAPESIDFLDEKLIMYELGYTNQLTLTDVARNLLSVVEKAIAIGKLKTRISWTAKQYQGKSELNYWYGKPVVYIRSHTRQKNSAVENLAEHKHLVNSVMTRLDIVNDKAYSPEEHKDMRSLDDFNNFYSEAVSLLLSSAQVNEFIEIGGGFTFKNLTSDAQVLNELSHFIIMYYVSVSLDLGRCLTAIDVAKLELKILKIEESLLSARKYGEVSRYVDEIQKGSHFSTIYKLVHKKIEILRKALELDEKVSSESYTRRISIIFGIIASATLSPELMQPLNKLYGITFSDPQVEKIAGIGASVMAVFGILVLSNYAVGLYRRVVQLLRR